MDAAYFVTAFIGGMTAVLSPCTWPFFPFYAGYISGSARFGPARILLNAAGFVLGFGALFTLLGAGLGLLGAWMFGPYADILRWASIGFLFFFGVLLLGAFEALMHVKPLRRLLDATRLSVLVAGELHLPFLRNPSHTSFFMSLAVGAVFAFGWTPCTGPILGSILTLAINFGGWERTTLLLAFYSGGLAVPFLLIAFALAVPAIAARVLPPGVRGRFPDLSRQTRPFLTIIKTLGSVMHRVAGAALIAFAVILWLDLFPKITLYLLEHF